MSFFDLVTNFYFILITVVILLIIHYKRRYNVWKSLGVVGPTPLPIFGTMLDRHFQTVPNIYLKNAKKYGRVYGEYDAFGHTLVVGDPKMVKQICVKDFHIFMNRRALKNFHEILEKMMFAEQDQEWKRQRKVISPTFSTGKIKRMKPLIEECIKNAIEHLDLIASKKEQLNLKDFWAAFTLEVIARCCFATNVNSHKEPENEFFKNVAKVFEAPGFLRILKFTFVFLFPRWLTKPLPIKLFNDENINYLAQASRHLLKQRREVNSRQNDFLQLLIEAEREAEEKKEPPLTETELIANCILFLFAGYETTASLLTWFSYSMAMNSEVQEKLFEEIKGHFGNAESIDYDVANKLPYLDAVVCETLRMYPPIIQTERSSNAEAELEGMGVKLPANTFVIIPVYAIHHDAEFFPEPEVFKPERFLGENRENIDPYAYLPFGIGPRNCVAMRFALIEAKLAIIQTILNFKFERSEKTPKKPEFAKFSQFLICKENCVNIIKR